MPCIGLSALISTLWLTSIFRWILELWSDSRQNIKLCITIVNWPSNVRKGDTKQDHFKLVLYWLISSVCKKTLANPANSVLPPMIFPLLNFFSCIFFAINFTVPETFPTNPKPWKSVRAFWSYSVRKENLIYFYIIR